MVSIENKKGFTLAEVLITLSIIGVVAALTIPTLTKNFEEMQNKVRFKNVFSNMSQAVQIMLSENGGTLNGNFEIRNFQKEFCNHLKCARICEYSSSADTREKGCWHNLGTSYFFNGDEEDSAIADGVILQDGTLIGFYDLENRAAPAGVSTDWHYMHECTLTGRGYGCAAKVLKNEDY